MINELNSNKNSDKNNDKFTDIDPDLLNFQKC